MLNSLLTLKRAGLVATALLCMALAAVAGYQTVKAGEPPVEKKTGEGVGASRTLNEAERKAREANRQSSAGPKAVSAIGAPPKAEGAEEPKDPKAEETVKKPEELKLFGYDYFVESRANVLKRREAPAGVSNALEGFAGPNVFVPTPDRYQLGPGDKLSIRVSSPALEPQTFDIAVDARGSLSIPLGGPRIVVRGQTLAQVEKQVQSEMRDLYRNAEVSLRLSELRTISVSLVGEAFSPGTYQVPSVATLFNLIFLTGGPSDKGSLRRIQVKRVGGKLISFDFYQFLLKGDNSFDTDLQPGDVIFIPPAESRVQVKGEVFRQAIYEILPGERLKSILTMAGGVKASGVGQRVSVESVTPGQERKLIDANILKSSDSDNPIMFDGDIVQVLSVRPVLANAVTIQGPVDQPGQYALTPGMTVADLIERARGLLPNAYLKADIFREKDDLSLELIKVDIGKALKKEPGADIPLLRNDKVVIYTSDVVTWLTDRFVTIEGAVKNPGRLVRAGNMTVQDAILQAGGLLPTASIELAFIQRENPDGTPGPLERIDLRRVVLNDPAHNLVLGDKDVVIIQSVQDANYTPNEMVEVMGVVQKPGNFRLGKGMTVKDVLALAGNPLPEAYFSKAFIQRTNKDGTVGPLLTFDLSKALAGDPSQNLALQHKDKISIYSVQQAKFVVEQTVTIRGGVQRPGDYPSSENMSLQDLIALAGGLMPNVSGKAEISSAWQPLGTPILQFMFEGVPGNYSVPNVTVKPGDTVSIPQRSDIVRRPPIVTILGAVTNPGAYVIDGKDDRVSDIIKRASGLRPDAFPEGAEFVRDPKYLTTNMQRSLQPRVVEVLQQVSDDNYKRISALIDLDKLKLVFSKGATVSIPPNGRPAAQPGEEAVINPTIDGALATALGANPTTPARPLTDRDLMPAGNLNVQVARAVAQPGGPADIELKDGDVILIPERPTSVNVIGAVPLPSSILYRPGANIGYYVQRAGWFTSDADTKSVLIIRANGELVRFRNGVKIELGDVIFVPTKVQAIRIRDSRETIDFAVQSLTTAASTLAILRTLGR